jgi:hypothetical protein
MSRPIASAYKTRNWPAYNEALKRRGLLAIWFDPAMIWKAAPTGKRGRVISPFSTGCIRRIHSAIFSFMAGVVPPIRMLERSLL